MSFNPKKWIFYSGVLDVLSMALWSLANETRDHVDVLEKKFAKKVHLSAKLWLCKVRG